ncbi:MAG: GyrI-like domain-containing protein [Anaerolineaceae bacterium]
MPGSQSREEFRSRIERVVTYATAHLEESLTLDTLARQCHFSPYHFHRIFTAIMDETPQDLVNRLRLERAANMLLKTSFTATEIAHRCGFSSSAVFARSFKKHFGVSASRYTLDNQHVILPSPSAWPEGFTTPEVRIASMPALHLAYIADMKGYSLAAICKAWERLYIWAEIRHLPISEMLVVGISFDDPLITPNEKCRFFACITVPPEVKEDALIGVLDIPASRCAVSRARVTAEQIQFIYRSFYRDWLPDSGLQPANLPSYEIYYETPENSSDGKYLMEVCVPVLPL